MDFVDSQAPPLILSKKSDIISAPFSKGVAFVVSRSWFGITIVVIAVVVFYAFVLYRNVWQIDSVTVLAAFDDDKIEEEFDTAYLSVNPPPEPSEDNTENDTGYDPSQDAAGAAADYLRVVKMCLLLGKESEDLAGCLEKPNLLSADDDEWIVLLNKWVLENYRAVETRCAERPECQNDFYPIR